ncbi:MAG: hypothetical protein AB1817_11515 [Chloroflexota bacterium]
MQGRKGKWQFLIMRELEKSGGRIFIKDLLPEGATINDYTALFRSARTLAKRGAFNLQPMPREGRTRPQLCAIERSI